MPLIIMCILPFFRNLHPVGMDGQYSPFSYVGHVISLPFVGQEIFHLTLLDQSLYPLSGYARGQYDDLSLSDTNNIGRHSSS